MRRWLVLVPILCFACKPEPDVVANQPSACGIDDLRATTTKIAKLTPHERGRAAWVGLKSACGDGLPAAFVAHFEAKDPRKTERLQNPATQNSELEPLIRKACGDWDTLRAVLADAPADQRALASFVACEAERYEVIPRDGATGFGSTEVSWALHQWLLDEGIERELGMAITHAMLGYERELASPVQVPSGLELPTAVGWELSEGVALYVSPDAVRVGGESVVKLDGAGHAAADALRSIPLRAALHVAPNQLNQLIIVADGRIPFATMLDLIDIARAAGCDFLGLAVNSPDHGVTLLALLPPPRADAGYFPAMTVELTGAGQASARTAADEKWIAIGRDDREGLLRFAQTVAKKFPSADTVILSADPEVPLQQVVDVIAAVRGPSCEPDNCVLPFALLSRTPAHQHHAAGIDEWGSLIGADAGEVYGVGGLGLLDKDKDAGAGGDVSSKVEQGKAEINGKLSDDIIRRIVRAHINEVRKCHEQGLKKNPTLAGNVTINFVINSSGKVPSAVVQTSTLGDSGVSNCIAKALKRWTFPKPEGGGNVVVSYPFELSPE